MIGLTETAAKRVREIAEKKGLEEFGLRLGVRGGGCSGLTYHIDLEETATDKDKVFESHGLRIFIDPKSYLYLNGTELHFADELQGGGFQFRNPNVRKACGCGESFSV